MCFAYKDKQGGEIIGRTVLTPRSAGKPSVMTAFLEITGPETQQLMTVKTLSLLKALFAVNLHAPMAIVAYIS